MCACRAGLADHVVSAPWLIRPSHTDDHCPAFRVTFEHLALHAPFSSRHVQDDQTDRELVESSSCSWLTVQSFVALEPSEVICMPPCRGQLTIISEAHAIKAGTLSQGSQRNFHTIISPLDARSLPSPRDGSAQARQVYIAYQTAREW